MDLIARLREALGADAVRVAGAGAGRVGTDVPARDGSEMAAEAVVAPRALLWPRSTGDVSAALAICHAAGQAVVPQGGMTGLVDASRPGVGEVAISLE